MMLRATFWSIQTFVTGKFYEHFHFPVLDTFHCVCQVLLINHDTAKAALYTQQHHVCELFHSEAKFGVVCTAVKNSWYFNVQTGKLLTAGSVSLTLVRVASWDSGASHTAKYNSTVATVWPGQVASWGSGASHTARSNSTMATVSPKQLFSSVVVFLVCLSSDLFFLTRACL